MTFDERFPARQHATWRVTMMGYRPNEAWSAQVCEECRSLVRWADRHEHSEHHERLNARIRKLERWRAVAR